DLSGVMMLTATGLPLGLFSHTTCDAPTVALSTGAALLLVSRGVVESRRNGEDFGLERLKKHLQRTTASSAKELGLSVLDSVKNLQRQRVLHQLLNGSLQRARAEIWIEALGE